MDKKKLSELLDFRNNSFNIIGMLLATLVVFYHSYPLYYGISAGNVDFISRVMRGNNLGSIAVSMFFIISGFLITSSLRKSDSAGQYIYKRIKRIFPALLICLVISALVIAPILSEIPKGEFLKNTGLYKNYIIDNILMIKNTIYAIADVFMNNPYPSAINGSIWTLKHQVFLYLIILILYKLKFIKKGKILLGSYFLITITYVMLQKGYIDNEVLLIREKLGYFGVFNEVDQFIKLLFYFFSGVVINCYMNKITVDKKNILGAVAILLISNYFGLLNYGCMIALPYLTIVIASIKTNFKLTDISYEMYILAFPIQQVIMYYTYGKINIITYIVASIVITIICAIILYYFVKFLVEKFEKLTFNN